MTNNIQRYIGKWEINLEKKTEPDTQTIIDLFMCDDAALMINQKYVRTFRNLKTTLNCNRI